MLKPNPRPVTATGAYSIFGTLPGGFWSSVVSLPIGMVVNPRPTPLVPGLLRSVVTSDSPLVPKLYSALHLSCWARASAQDSIARLASSVPSVKVTGVPSGQNCPSGA